MPKNQYTQARGNYKQLLSAYSSMFIDSHDDGCVPLSGTSDPVHLRPAAAQHRRRGGQDPLTVLHGPPFCSFRWHTSKGGGVHAHVAPCQTGVPFLEQR